MFNLLPALGLLEHRTKKKKKGQVAVKPLEDFEGPDKVCFREDDDDVEVLLEFRTASTP